MLVTLKKFNELSAQLQTVQSELATAKAATQTDKSVEAAAVIAKKDEAIRLATEIFGAEVGGNLSAAIHAGKLSELFASVKAKSADMQAQVATLTNERDTYKTEAETTRATLADLQTRFDDLTAKASKLATEAVTVEKQAKVIALEMTQAQGTPPVAETPSSTTTSTLSLWEQFQAITDPAKRVSFWRENKNAILAEQKKTAKG